MLTEIEIVNLLELEQICFLNLLIEKSLLDKENLTSLYKINMRIHFYEGRINGLLAVLDNDEIVRDRICKNGFNKALEKIRTLEVFEKLSTEQIKDLMCSVGFVS
jgi:hypothetical protein